MQPSSRPSRQPSAQEQRRQDPVVDLERQNREASGRHLRSDGPVPVAPSAVDDEAAAAAEAAVVEAAAALEAAQAVQLAAEAEIAA